MFWVTIFTWAFAEMRRTPHLAHRGRDCSGYSSHFLFYTMLYLIVYPTIIWCASM